MNILLTLSVRSLQGNLRPQLSLFQVLGSRGQTKTRPKEKNEGGLRRDWKGREKACKNVTNLF